MKKITKILASVLAVAGLAACEPKGGDGGKTSEASVGVVFGQIGSAGLDTTLGCLMEAGYDYTFEAKDAKDDCFYCYSTDGEMQAETFAYDDFAEGSVLVLATGFSGKGAGVLANYITALEDLVAHESHFAAIIVVAVDTSSRGSNSDQLLDVILPVADVVLYDDAVVNQGDNAGYFSATAGYQFIAVDTTNTSADNYLGTKVISIANSFLAD